MAIYWITATQNGFAGHKPVFSFNGTKREAIEAIKKDKEEHPYNDLYHITRERCEPTKREKYFPAWVRT